MGRGGIWGIGIEDGVYLVIQNALAQRIGHFDLSLLLLAGIPIPHD